MTTTTLGLLFLMPLSGGDWITYLDATEARLVAASSVGDGDVSEKDFAWADFDHDGDIDLVVVRKQPWASTGRRANTLFMNEDGVLVDRTSDLATDSDVTGDLGFLTPTNDRDVVVSDVDGDGWPDLITAVTLSDGQPKHIGHPRVYINKGDTDGTWLGFRHEAGRIPQLFTADGTPANPRFNAVSAGDVTGDGFPDLFFADGDLGGGDQSLDLNDRLLVNDGNGFFEDQSTDLMTDDMLISGVNTSCAIVDMNGDGHLDVVRCTTLTAPLNVGIAYNSDDAFTDHDIVYAFSGTHVSVADLDGNGLPDLIVTDDGVDRFLLNTGNGADGFAEFSVHALASSTSGFGGNSIARDLDGDGALDFIITDVDFDIAGCTRETRFFQNTGSPADTGFLEVPPGGTTASEREGWHDVAVFDIDGNGTLDLVIGACSGLRIGLGTPVSGVDFEYPFGRPELLPPDVVTGWEVNLVPTGGGSIETGTATLHVSIDGGPFGTSPIVQQMGIVHQAMFPAAGCRSSLRWYTTVEMTDGSLVVDPPGAPEAFHRSWIAATTSTVLSDDFEDAGTGWTVTNESLTSGAWERADPNGTTLDGDQAAPEDDATDGGTFAYVTQNGLPGEAAGTSDVDGGPTRLTSPAIDLSGTDARIAFARWLFSDDGEDPFEVEVSNDDGASWQLIPELTTLGTEGWARDVFVVGDWVEPSATVRVRFSIGDSPNNSITEAGLDEFRVDQLRCDASCPADVTGDGSVGLEDLVSALAAWGRCPGCPADVVPDGIVDFEDVLAILADWGRCD